MVNVLGIEIKKVFCSRTFWIALAVASIITVVSGVHNIQSYYNEQQIRNEIMQTSQDSYMNPDLPVYSVFNRWVGQTYNEVGASLFYLLLPMLAAFSYSWSFYDERKSGYVRNVVSRTGRKAYLISKYVAVFISGAVTIIFAMALNFLLVSSFLPAVKPDVYYDIYNGIATYTMGYQLFYEQPWIFILFRFALGAAFGGASAVSVVALTFYMRNRFELLLMPFFFFLTINYFSSIFSNYVYEVEISPLQFIHGGGSSSQLWIAGIYIAGLLSVSAGIMMRKGAREDVF